MMNTAFPDTAREVLDFDELLHRCMDNVDVATRVLGKFRAQFQDELGRLECDVRRGDLDGVAGIAHRMKGATASVSAPKLNELSASIDRLARDGRLTSIPPLVEQLCGEWERFAELVKTNSDIDPT